MDILQQLERNFKMQYGNYARLQELTVRQQKAINKTDTEGLQKLIDEKQKLIKVIDDQQAEIENEKKILGAEQGVAQISLSALERFFPVEKVEPLRSALKELQKLMEDIMTMEKKNETLLRGQMEKVKNEINHVQVGKRAMNSYGQTYSPDAFYFDKKK